MDTKLVALSLVLQELGVGLTIDSLEDRILLQKAVYVSQQADVDLGYRFSWYIRGPYSPSLAKDYYRLEAATVDEPEPTRGKKLRPHVGKKLRELRPLMSVPKGVKLNPSEWLELVSSIHYLHNTVGRDDPSLARERLCSLKPRHSKYMERAESELVEFGLLDSSQVQ